MTAHPYVHADWGVDVHVVEVFEDLLFNRAEKSLCRPCRFSGTLGSLQEFLCLQSLSIELRNKNLGDLEEITVWFKRSEFGAEGDRLVCSNFCTAGYDSERILNYLSTCLIEYFQKMPIHFDRESVLVLKRDRTPLAQTAAFCETEVDVLTAELDITSFSH